MNAKVSKDGELTITTKLMSHEEAPLSDSGKNKVVAKTGGFTGEFVHEGRIHRYNLTVIVKP